ncbi:hypothetical protein ET475_10745 [Microbacterium protaetiae]|uniref:Uncharacterized protein n=1 Tax=Microbacterium protaetiae TaxID=2509458 RepID=A0A4P6EF49_9MICO|nr:hypothetical protein [Microbacterium protaetiae]QAY60416.1 hypothetical protein ET475_10745 [Microbacterium protaetiae]
MILALGGCASSDMGDGWERPEIPSVLPSFTANSTLPFEKYELNRLDRERLQQGTSLLLGRCLEEYGLSARFSGDYMKQTFDGDGQTPAQYQWGGWLGTMTASQASEFAYTAPPGAPWQNGSGFYLSNPANLSPYNYDASPIDYARISGALYGPDEAVIIGDAGAQTQLSDDEMPRNGAGKLPPSGGCARLVDKELGTPLVSLTEVENDAYGLTFGDDRVKARMADWVSCMADSGFEFERVDDGAVSNAGDVSPYAVSVAVADVKCTKSSRWPDTFYFVLGAYQQQAIDKTPEFFESALRAESERLHTLDHLVG